MANFLVRNSLNPNKVISCGITYRQLVPKNNEGDLVWVIEIATDAPDINGNSIRPEFLHLTSLDDMDDEIQGAVGRISDQVDWGITVEDSEAPYVYSISPGGYDVALSSSVKIVVKDNLPSAGIDVDSIVMTVNDFDVTNELEMAGDPYEYTIKWSPFLRVADEY